MLLQLVKNRNWVLNLYSANNVESVILLKFIVTQLTIHSQVRLLERWNIQKRKTVPDVWLYRQVD